MVYTVKNSAGDILTNAASDGEQLQVQSAGLDNILTGGQKVSKLQNCNVVHFISDYNLFLSYAVVNHWRWNYEGNGWV